MSLCLLHGAVPPLRVPRVGVRENAIRGRLGQASGALSFRGASESAPSLCIRLCRLCGKNGARRGDASKATSSGCGLGLRPYQYGHYGL